MMTRTPFFKYKNQKINIRLTYNDIINVYPDQFDLELLDFFESLQETMMTIMLNDKVMLKIWYRFVEQATKDSFEDALDELEPGQLTNFKEGFWQEVVNFSPPFMQETLIEAWEEAKKTIKSAGKNLLNSLQDSEPESQDSTPTTSP